MTGAALLAALAATLLAGAVAPARAQGYRVVIEDEDEAILPPRAVVFRLGRAGFTGMSHPRFDGETYRVEADSPWGNRVQLVVDARTGRILDRERLEAPLLPPGTVPGGRRPGYGWTETEARPPWPREDAFRDRAPRDGGWRDGGPRDGGPYAPVPLSRGGPLPPVGERPEERRVAARPLPQPAPQPGAPSYEAPARAAPAPRTAGPNPLGMNPDSPAARTGAAPRRETTPDGAKPEAAKPEGSKAEGSKPEAPRRTAARTKPAETETPAALVPPLAPKAEPVRQEAHKQDTQQPAKAAEAAPLKAPEAKDGGWKTPPDGNRPVRVIGGITQVPGKGEPAKD